MKKFLIALLCALILAPAANTFASNVTMPKKEATEKAEKKDKKKKDKKKKKQRSVEEILADLQALPWDKPEKSGLAIDAWYDEADGFFEMVRGVDDKVALYTIRAVVSESGDTVLAPVDKHGVIRHRNEAFDQVAQSVSYVAELLLKSTALAAGTVTHAIQIGQDAIPMVGNSARKKANTQIAKATKAIPLLKEIVGTQNNMMKKYKELNYKVSSNDADVEAMAELNIDFNDCLQMTDEELAAWENEGE